MSYTKSCKISAFGKIDRSGDAWLPLADHMTDVGRCFERLCRCNALNRALCHLSRRPLDEVDLARLALLAYLHDLGKASSSFQSKRWRVKEERPRHWPVPSGHGREALALFTTPNLQPLALALPLDEMDDWGEATESLLIAAISHHGRPIVDEGVSVAKATWKPVTDAQGRVHYDPLPVLKEIARTARCLFPAAFGPVAHPLPDNPAFGHLFAGLVQFADWLGSDTRHFPIRIESERGEAAKIYAAQAIAVLGLESTPKRIQLLAAAPTFAQTFSAPAPYPIQAVMADKALGPLLILESETGSGKTEAALWRFVHLFQSGAVDSLYFALPTRVSAKQIYDRVRQAIARLWPEDPPLVVRALPGYAAADGEEPLMLPDFQVLWSDEANDDTALRRWAAEAPKRFLAAPIAVGTIDQALLGILKVKHAHMRYALLARSLLVVDEVHASDTYMTVVLEKLLQAHLGHGGHALLLSATLGSSARTRYLALGQRDTQPPSFEQAWQIDYPALSDHQGLRPMAATGRTKRVSWSLQDCIDEPGRIAALAIDAARTGAKVLVVRNTVAAAMELFRALEAHPEAGAWLFRVNGVACLHHSRFSRQDRPLLDGAIEAELGKKRPPGPRILIGTQTLEQSLDIDADLLISDLCPMDVLLQRIGRLHRHQRDRSERPAAYATPQALILTPSGQDLIPLLERSSHGLGRFTEGGGVYPDLRIAEATRRLIQDHPQIEIPRDNRRLVESATHPTCLGEIERSMGEAWVAHGQKLEGDSGAHRSVAHLHLLEIDKAFSSDPNMAFPTEYKISSRLGVEDRLITFDPPPPGPFGEPLKQIPIRAHLLPTGLALDAQPLVDKISEGQMVFRLGEACFRYSRIGLERVRDA